MKYRDTRGGETNLTFENVLVAGYARNNGLYVPESIPVLSRKELDEWSSFKYCEIVFNIFRKFICSDEISDVELKGIIDSSYLHYSHPAVINVKKLPCELSVIELFHGPTLAFKDFALSVISGLLEFFMAKKEKHLISLVGTSGDTGSAAIESVRGRKYIDIIVLYPKGRCTRIQELQMTTVLDKNVHVICVDGTSDDLDVPIKQCFADTQFVSKYNLLVLNSINWARILGQIPLYFYAYYQLASEIGQPVELIIPTGAAGSLTAGCIANKMGLPIRLISAVNANDIVARTLQKGDFTLAEEVKPTLSSAMDIQVPYNLERILYLFSEGNVEDIGKWMQKFESDGCIQIPQSIRDKIKTVIVDSHTSTDDNVVEIINKINTEFKYLICPHTATGAAYHFKKRCDMPRGLFATASPEKFPEAIQSAGASVPSNRVEHLFEMPTRCENLTKEQDWLEALREKIKYISQI